MEQNENSIDRIIRLVLGIIFISVGWFYFKNNTIGIIFDVLGAVALFTAATGFCLLYKLFGNFSTKK